MPIREYVAVDEKAGCSFCVAGFDEVEAIEAEALSVCPKCGAAVQRQISAPRVGRSESGVDDRAKNAGFSKLKKLGSGEYEKLY